MSNLPTHSSRAHAHKHTRACFFFFSRIREAGALLPVYLSVKTSTYISVMFSMSDSGTKTGKSSIPGSWSIHEILEALQKHDTGQAELSLSSPNKTPHSPQRAIPRTPAVIAGLVRCIHCCVMSYSIFSNSEMRRRCCGMRKDVVRDARLSWSGLFWSPQKGDNATGRCSRANVLRYPGFASSRRGGKMCGRRLCVSTGCGGDADVSHPALRKKTSETVCVCARVWRGSSAYLQAPIDYRPHLPQPSL